MQVEKHERQVAREQLVTALLGGQSWQEVNKGPDVPVKRAMAYRLLRAVRIKGETALQDGRHGHPSKLRGEADLQVSVSQINRVRAALGVSNHSKQSPQEKKR